MALRTRQHGPADRRGGFTLVELMVATALMSIFLLMVATIFTQSQAVISRSKASVNIGQEARALFDQLAHDLNGAKIIGYPSASGVTIEGYFRGDDASAAYESNDPPGKIDPKRSDSGGPYFTDRMPKLYFTTTTPQPSMVSTAADGEPEPFIVSYRLVWSGASMSRVDSAGNKPTPPNDLRGVFRLERRVLNSYNIQYENNSTKYGQGRHELETESPSGSGRIMIDWADPYNDTDAYVMYAEPMAFNVLWMEIRYFDDWKRSWVESWPASRKDRLPSAVEVTLTVADPEHRREETFTSRFFLPNSVRP
jgi:prepilin-type N-terminal cleavage/methylation domain-containing protein